MADEAGMTQARIEAEDAMRAKQAPAQALPPVTGQCMYCGEATAEHFCSTDCRKDWDRETKIRRAQGLA